MLNKLKKPNQKGFTIIEVMIVLAIAGLILLIVFLAVPALQRNSRNTSRKSDVGRVGAAVTTVLGNNNGAIASITGTTGNTNIQAELGNLSYYTGTLVTTATPTTTTTNGTTVDTINVYPGAICAAFTTGGGRGATTTGANTRNVAITYRVEPGGNTQRNCVDQ
jgi:prepilin-type N-terminal cleavage/methylation domain-containing protein